MRIVCLQTILMKYRALFVIFKKTTGKFEIVVCCKISAALYGLKLGTIPYKVLHANPIVDVQEEQNLQEFDCYIFNVFISVSTTTIFQSF